jgi:hypothetical protein
VTVVGIEAAVLDRFGTELSAPEQAAVPVAAAPCSGCWVLAAGERAGPVGQSSSP